VPRGSDGDAQQEHTHIIELVPAPPNWKGTVDASGKGAGGVWLPGTKPIAPVVWRLEWPLTVHKRLVTFDKPTGTITNSDLELAAEILGWLVLEAIIDTQWTHVGE